MWFVSPPSERQVNYSYQSYSQKYHQQFGVPMVIKMPKKCTYRELYSAIYQRYAKALTPWTVVKQLATEKGLLEALVAVEWLLICRRGASLGVGVMFTSPLLSPSPSPSLPYPLFLSLSLSPFLSFLPLSLSLMFVFLM